MSRAAAARPLFILPLICRRFSVNTITKGWCRCHHPENIILPYFTPQIGVYTEFGIHPYGDNLMLFLESNNYSYMDFNPLLVSRFVRSKTLRNIKSDSLDAESIARYLMRVEYKPYPPSFYHINKLKSPRCFYHQLSIATKNLSKVV